MLNGKSLMISMIVHYNMNINLYMELTQTLILYIYQGCVYNI